MFELDSCAYNRPAVLYSGGADSTLLYYLVLADLLKGSPLRQLDLLIVNRYNNPIEKATQLYNKLRIQFNDTISQLRVISVPDDTPGHLQVLRAVAQVQDEYDVIYWGVNQYPDDTTIRPKTDYTVNFAAYQNHSKLKLPFTKYNKADIVRTFVELGLEEVLNNTHSCGTPELKPCGKCFNCRERTWAYQQLGLKPHLGI